MREAVLDKGFVELVDSMGNDYSILRSARVSTGSDTVKGEKKDRALIRYLYKNQHLTPFEQVVFTFHMRSPLFVNQQLLRHRSFSFNQESARYKEFEWDTYCPEEWRTQDTNNKQMSNGIIKSASKSGELFYKLNHTYGRAKDFYNYAIEEGVSREIARVTMPMGQYTEIFFTVDLRNLLHFLELRMHPHAQLEIRLYAEAIYKMLMNFPWLKWTMEIFTEMQKMNYAISEYLSGKDIEPEDVIKRLNEGESNEA